MNTGPKIVPGSAVRLHFSLALPDGTEAVSTFDDEPLDLIMGDGTLSPGLELALYALRAGDEETLRIEGDLAFGRRDESNVHWLPLDRFPADIQPTPGLVIGFATPEGQETPGTVLEVVEGRARVDFNHPLSGRELVLRARILSVTPPEQ